MEGMKTLNEEEKETIVRLATNNSRYKHKYVMLVRKRFHSDFIILHYTSAKYTRSSIYNVIIKKKKKKKSKVTRFKIYGQY